MGSRDLWNGEIGAPDGSARRMRSRSVLLDDVRLISLPVAVLAEQSDMFGRATRGSEYRVTHGYAFLSLGAAVLSAGAIGRGPFAQGFHPLLR